VVFAGTFDHLHEGHKHIIRTAFKLSHTVSLGLTTDRMLAYKSDKDLIQKYDERYEELEKFINSEFGSEVSNIFPIETREGGADTMKDLEALIVSDEIGVVQNAFDINQMRIDNGLRGCVRLMGDLFLHQEPDVEKYTTRKTSSTRKSD
jgi:pantetheine-phosphate adenylyltransferase